jgi:Ca-activated chloride channel family protein
MGNAMPLPNGEIDSLFRYSLNLFWEEALHRQGDLFGVISFARVPEIVLPLTPDKNRLKEVLASLKPETPGSPNDATAITYSLYKAVYLAEGAEKKSQAFKVNRNAIILITDGNEKVPEEDLKDPLRGIALAAVLKKAKEAGVHIYILSLFPSYNDPKYGPEKRRMELIAKSTNGGFFQATPEELKELFEKIDALEGHSPTLTLPMRGEGVPLAPLLVAIALLALLLYLLFREVVYLSLP